MKIYAVLSFTSCYISSGCSPLQHPSHSPLSFFKKENLLPNFTFFFLTCYELLTWKSSSLFQSVRWMYWPDPTWPLGTRDSVADVMSPAIIIIFLSLCGSAQTWIPHLEARWWQKSSTHGMENAFISFQDEKIWLYLFLWHGITKITINLSSVDERFRTFVVSLPLRTRKA